MILAKPFKVITMGISCVILSISLVFAAIVGKDAPYFRVTSGSDEVLTLDMLKGKIVVIFYETKDTKEKNRALKEELNAFYADQPPEAQEGIAKIAIIRCSSFLPTIWRRSLRENSKKEGIIIYGDWDGSMEKNYDMAADESNFLIIDKSGVVRYVRADVIPEEDFPIIKKILNELQEPMSGQR
ncbi:MAG: redoxin domain-containing protein [Candidatus Omnitrophica bacterium]|nr:redoxin domain-containing protein [Candidatus Omnitrophota bacterium]